MEKSFHNKISKHPILQSKFLEENIIKKQHLNTKTCILFVSKTLSAMNTIYFIFILQ
jgi:hypothetical protein